MSSLDLEETALPAATDVTDAARLLGSWQLVRWEIGYSDARPSSFPFGPDATGLIHYTHDGGMSACIARQGRAPLSGPSVRSAPQPQQLAAFESYFQYAGRFHVRTAPGRTQVVHQVTHSLNPNFVGTQQVRDVGFADDGTLTLSADDDLPDGSGVVRHHRLIWRRAPSP
jgi:hypothetical protein